MLPKVDYVLITSLFVCIKMITMLGVFPSFDEPYEVIVCNGTVWQRMVPLLFGLHTEIGEEEYIWRR